MPWLTKTQLIANMKTLADQNPALCSYQSIGKTFNNNDIWLFRVGKNPNKILIDGATHGMENPGSHTVMYLMEWLLGGSADANYILSRLQVVLVPIVNYDKCQNDGGAGNPIYRKNNRPDPVIGVGCPVTTDPPRCNGVDINRNYVRGWSAQTDTLGAYYSGLSAGSEPETQAMRNMFNSEAAKVYVNIHDWGGPIWLAVGYDGLATPVNALLDRYGVIVQGYGFTPYVRSLSSGAGGQAKDDGCRNGQTLSVNWEQTGAFQAPADGNIDVALIQNTKRPHLSAFVKAVAEIYGAEVPTTKYLFKQWNDGVMDNPRTVSVATGQNYEYVANYGKTHLLVFQSVPIAVTATVNGRPLASGESMEIAEGSTVTVSVPATV